ncbi:MAG: alpha/beta hydrolase [Brevinema sp.]
MKNIFSTIMLLLMASCATDELIITKQGNFTAGGTVITNAGTYTSQNFNNWQPYPEGQTYHGDHASVFYQIPKNPKKNAMVFLHGAFQSGKGWQTTPDGRDGFQTLFLKKGYATYVMDQPRRGQAGKSMVSTTITPVPDEQMWFEIWRMGHWPNHMSNTQFPQDPASLEEFFRWITPNTGAFDNELVAQSTAAVFDKSGAGVLVTHSQGGLPGWFAAAKTDKITAVVAYEPGTYVFPEGEVPAPLPSRTGTLNGVAVPLADFEKLTKIPLIIYFGDYIPEADKISDDLGAENWRVRLELGRQFVEAINRHGGNATMVDLPKIGIYGNTHFLFAEKNNVELADHLSDWLKKNSLQ